MGNDPNYRILNFFKLKKKCNNVETFESYMDLKQFPEVGGGAAEKLLESAQELRRRRAKARK